MGWRATITDGRGHERGVWGTSTLAVPQEHPLDPELVRSINAECERYIGHQWRDTDTAKMLDEIRDDRARQVSWIVKLRQRYGLAAAVTICVAGIAIVLGLVYVMRAASPMLKDLSELIVPALILIPLALRIRRHGFSWGVSTANGLPVPVRVRAAALLNHGRCADCGYSIHGIPAEPDGCTVCPECGAAWMIPDKPPI